MNLCLLLWSYLLTSSCVFCWPAKSNVWRSRVPAVSSLFDSLLTHPIKRDASTSLGDTGNRKILGTSVVASVSEEDQTKKENGKRKKIPSPSHLLSPDRYEFYTFDDDGQLVKKIMSINEIKKIIASNDDGHTTETSVVFPFSYYHKISSIPAIQSAQPLGKINPHEPIFSVHDVIESVQKVLNSDYKTKLTGSGDNKTAEVPTDWKVILPSLLAGSSQQTVKILPANQTVLSTTEKVPGVTQQTTTTTTERLQEVTQTTAEPSTTARVSAEDKPPAVPLTAVQDKPEAMLLDGAHPGLMKKQPGSTTTSTTTTKPFELTDAHPAYLLPPRVIPNKTLDTLEKLEMSKLQIPLNQDLAESVSSVLSQIASEISMNSVVSFDKSGITTESVEGTTTTESGQEDITTGLPLSWLKTNSTSAEKNKTVSPIILNFKLQNKPRPFQKPTETPVNIEVNETTTQTNEPSTRSSVTSTEEPSTTVATEQTTVEEEILDGQESSSSKTKVPSINLIPNADEKVAERIENDGLPLEEEVATTTTEPIDEIISMVVNSSQSILDSLSNPTTYAVFDQTEITTTTVSDAETTEELAVSTDNLETNSSVELNQSSNLVADNNSLSAVVQYSNRPVLQQKPVYIKPVKDSGFEKPAVVHLSTTPTIIHLDEIPNGNLGLESSVTRLDEDVRTFVDLCNELAFSLWSSITHSGISSARSLVLSPFATTSLLAMVFLGARGPTSGQMNEVLKLDDMVTFNPHLVFRNVTESVVISRNPGVATATFVRELYSDRNKGKLLDFYKERALQFYDGYVEEVNFNIIGDIVRRRTNLLIKRQTWGKVSEFLRSSSLIPRAPLAAFSANIFQTDCTTASTDGRDGEIYFVVLPSSRLRRLVPVPAAVWKSGFLAGYEPDLDATAVAFSPDNSVVSTIFVLPGQQGVVAPGDSLARLEQRLLDVPYRHGHWSKLLRSLVSRPGLEVQIPRISHRSVINVTSSLQKMGLKDLFNAERADLRGLNGLANDLHLSDMIQVNMFSTCGEDDGEGSHHSEIYPASPYLRKDRGLDTQFSDSVESLFAVSDFEDPIISSMPLALRPRQARIPDAITKDTRTRNENESSRLKFDRPFLFFVRHNPTGLILHMGRFNPRLLP